MIDFSLGVYDYAAWTARHECGILCDAVGGGQLIQILCQSDYRQSMEQGDFRDAAVHQVQLSRGQRHAVFWSFCPSFGPCMPETC